VKLDNATKPATVLSAAKASGSHIEPRMGCIRGWGNHG
jgi:hypothetical protein